MKTLTDHTILFDDECPMCREYTRAFVKTGMLDRTGGEAYSQAVTTRAPHVDWNRARNEIALINNKDLSVTYGVESLMTILGHSLPFLKPLFQLRTFRLAMNRLYFFISFNRKVIAPGKVFEGKNTCTPDMNPGYRWAYIVFAWLVTSTILTFYADLTVPMVPASGFLREFAVCGGQLLFQGTIVGAVRKDRLIHYLGNVMTVSLIGALLLCPVFLLRLIYSNPFYIGYFMVVVGFLFFEHRRRVKILELPWYISGTWVIYRFLVLLVIL